MPLFLRDPRVKAVRADIRSQDEVGRLLGTEVGRIEAVVHLAAIVGDGACQRNEELARQVNVQGTRNLAEITRALGTSRFIFSSTCSNYGVSDDALATEESPIHAAFIYAATKVEAESYLLRAATASFHPTILRFATVYGVAPRMSFVPLLNALVCDAVTKGEIQLYGPSAWRPFVHVDDAVQAILACLEGTPEKISGQVFNVGGENYQKGQLVAILRRLIPKACVMTMEEADSRSYRVSFEKIARELGFRAARKVEEGVREMVAYLRRREMA